MKQNTVLIAVIALLVGGIVGYAIFDKDQYGMDDMMHDGGDQHDYDNDRTDDMGAGHMDHSTMMVESEEDFLRGMIPHHQEAIDTAREVVARGGSTPAIKALAEAIIVAQEKEVALMKQWYEAWYGEVYEASAEDYTPMMRELSALEGAALDQRFLEDMVMHHMGAIMMARSVQPYIEHQEITDLTAAIVETQTDEIELMRNLLQELE